MRKQWQNSSRHQKWHVADVCKCSQQISSSPTVYLRVHCIFTGSLCISAHGDDPTPQMRWIWAGASSKTWRWLSWTSGRLARPSRSSSSPRPLTASQTSTPPCRSVGTRPWWRSRRSWRLLRNGGRYRGACIFACSAVSLKLWPYSWLFYSPFRLYQATDSSSCGGVDLSAEGGKKVEADERGERREETRGGRLGWLKEGNERPEAASQGQAHNGSYSSSKQDGEERKRKGESSALCSEAHCCLKWTPQVPLSSSAWQLLLKKEANTIHNHLRIAYLKGRKGCGGLM